MKIGIMQPYFLPYLGYWQLMNLVDEYVILDDVNYIKRGWVNRNRILLNGKDHMITLPMDKANPFMKINENTLCDIPDKIIKTIDLAYHKAPLYRQGISICEKILSFKERNLAKFLINSIRVVAEALNIETNLLVASELNHSPELKAQEMIIDICRIRNATEYYNAIGGMELYSQAAFAAKGMRLFFLKSKLPEYNQFGNGFVPGLSILDLLMFNPIDKIKDMLAQYELCTPIEKGFAEQ